MNKFKLKPWMVITAIIIILTLWFFASYNKLVTLSANVDNAWANVETTYQRRIDLIPNLVNTVKGYALHEQQLFTEITELRSQWQAAKNTGNTNQQIQSINQLEGALARLLVVVENYPQLKANENFLSLQDELAGTENRISVERQRYNENVKRYNTAIKRFPTMIVANIFDYEQRNYFQAEQGAENAPPVKF